MLGGTAIDHKSKTTFIMKFKVNLSGILTINTYYVKKINVNSNIIIYNTYLDNLVVHIFGDRSPVFDQQQQPKKGNYHPISHYLKYEAGMNKLNKSHVFLLKMSLWTFFMVQTSFLNICCCVDVRYETLEDIHSKMT